MGTPNELDQLRNRARQQHTDFLRCLLDMPATEAHQASQLLAPEAFGDNWQAKTIHQGIQKATRKDGRAYTLPLTEAVNTQLLEDGELENPHLRSYWLDIVAPSTFRPLEVHHAPTLARLIAENAFRDQYAQIFACDPAATLTTPIDQLTGHIAEITQRLRDAYSRIPRTVRKTNEKEEKAA